MPKPPILNNRWFYFCKIKIYKQKQIKNKILKFIFKNKQRYSMMKTEIIKYKNIQTEDYGWLRIFGLQKRLHKFLKG
jgi:hypothetical protein